MAWHKGVSVISVRLQAVI